MHAQLLGVDLCMVLLRVHKGPFEFSHQSPHMWSCSVAGVAPGSANMYCIHTYVCMYVCEDGFCDEDPLGRYLEQELCKSLPCIRM